MATDWEQQQQEKAAQDKTKTMVRSGAGTAVDLVQKTALKSLTGSSYTSTGILSTAIDITGTLGIVAYQYFSAQKAQKKKAKLDKKIAFAQEQVDRVLDVLLQTGVAVVEKHGIDPTTAQFEEVLYKGLFPIIGYRGSCNIIAWAPDTKAVKGVQRPYLFKVTDKGKTFTAMPGFASPPNIQTYYYVQCKNMRDHWAAIYQQLLINQGRVEELEAFQSEQKKGVKILRISFVLIFSLLMFFVIKYGMQIK